MIEGREEVEGVEDVTVGWGEKEPIVGPGLYGLRLTWLLVEQAVLG